MEYLGQEDYDHAKFLFDEVRADHPKSSLSPRAADKLVVIKIRKLQGGSSSALPPPTEAGNAPPGTTTVEIRNGAAADLEILYSGPDTGSAELPPGDPVVRLELPPGTYEMVAHLPGSDIRPYTGTWTLTSGTAYKESYTIRSYSR